MEPSLGPPAPPPRKPHYSSDNYSGYHGDNNGSHQYFRGGSYGRGRQERTRGGGGGRGGWDRGGIKGGRGRSRCGKRGGNGTFHLEDGKDDSKEKKHNFYCCSCERGFKTQEQADEHQKEHIICGLDGCQFEAHALVVTKHIRIQHEGNLYQRLKNLNTPEDIERWRQERKKNYPTSQKAQQKDDERKEKVERREICGISSNNPTSSSSSHPTSCAFRYKIQKHDPRTRSYMECERKLRIIESEQSDGWMKRPFAPDKNARHIRVPFFSMNKSKIVYLENFYLNVKMRNGKVQKQTKVKWKGFKAKELDRLTDSESESEDQDIPISDEEDDDNYEGGEGGGACVKRISSDSEEKTVVNAPTEIVKSSSKPFGNLMLVDYSSASDSEQDEEEDGSKDLQSPVVGTTTNEQSSITVNRLSADDKQNDKISESSALDSFVIEEFIKDNTFKDKPIFKKPMFKTRKGWFRTKLLETLLQDQIRKERNILLQTCRFIRENDFFGHN